MSNKLKVSASMFAIVALMSITTGMTIALFSYQATGFTENTITTSGISFHYKEVNGKGHGISISDAFPVASNETAKTSNNYFDFKITSSISPSEDIKIPYVVTARMNQGSDSVLGDIIDLYLTEVDNGVENPTTLFETNLPKYNELEQYDKIENYTEKIIYTDTVNSASYEKNFRLRMWIDENVEMDSPTNYNNKTFSITVNVNATGKVKTNTVSGLLNELILADNTAKTSPVSFTTAATTAEQSGFYEMTTANGYGGTGNKTYYFRGNVTNNVVKFADKTWRVVRINEDGTTRVILDTVIDDNVYPINTNFFGDNLYMFYSESDSAKAQLENWYTTNITGTNATKVASGNYFCEVGKAKPADDEYQTWTSPTAVLYSSYTPDLSCQPDTTNNKQYITSSVGLLTYDEAVLAGNYQNTPNLYNYLYKGINADNNVNWWTMSPAGIAQGIYFYDYAITSNGTLYPDYTNSTYYLRPVINLKANTTATKDANGYYIVD